MNPRHKRLKSAMMMAGLVASLASASLICTSVAYADMSASSVVSQAEPRIGKQAIVKFDKSVAGDSAKINATIEGIATSLGFDIDHQRTLAVGAEVLRVESPAQVNALVAALKMRDDVVYAEADLIMQISATPNDTRYNEQWHYFESTGGLRADQAWDTTTGNGTVVAVIDTGYRPHADLDSKILPGYDFIGDTAVANDGNGRDSDAQDPGDWTATNECGVGSPASNSSWHGTHVAGTIGAESNNNQGVAGVAWGADILPIRVLGKCGGYTSDIADGIVWSAGGSVSGVPANSNPADVLNLSLGGGGSCPSTTQSAINTARSLGATVVVAAGNSNANASKYTPASCSGVVTVAATNRNGSRSYYSNYGSVVDVAAPGGDTASGSSNGVLSTLNTGTTTPGSDSYAFYQGTSMATPHVAGVAALLYAVNPSITPDTVETTLKNTARAFPGSCSQCGSGLVDANAAVLDGGSGGGGGGGATELTNGTPETGLSGGSGEQLFFTLEVPAGESTLDFDMSGGSGDADLYVKFGSAPTTSSYDCRPYLNGNTESCSFSNPAAGTWHVMINGYTSFSGVSLTGTHASGGGGSCPSGYTEYTGNLTGTGDESFEPDGTYYYTGSSGTHAGILTGEGSDFDLYLRKWNGSGWSNVSSSTSSNSEESISYSGTSGYYTWRVYSYSGSGNYSLCLSTP